MTDNHTITLENEERDLLIRLLMLISKLYDISSKEGGNIYKVIEQIDFITSMNSESRRAILISLIAKV